MDNNQNFNSTSDNGASAPQYENKTEPTPALGGDTVNAQPVQQPTEPQSVPQQAPAQPIEQQPVPQHVQPSATPMSTSPFNVYTAPQNTQPDHSGAAQQSRTPDFGRYQGAAPTYTSIPQYGAYEARRETVYASAPAKKEKKPKAKLGMGAAAALIAVCVLLSGGAAFAGTYIAGSLSSGGTPTVGADKVTAGTPSVVLQSYSNPNKTPGTFESVSEAVAPTVVEITTESIVTDAVFWGGNYVTSGAGSGVIISSDGLIITNNHVVSGANTITVTLTDGTSYDATIIGTDSESDIAVIKVEAEGLPFALLGDSDELQVGQEVIAVGNPLGELGGTVTNGIISALSRDITIDGSAMTLIQTNAAVNPGNSGGGLFNLYGELVGIVNAKSTMTSSGTSVEGIGYAIPVNTAAKVSEELANYGYVRGRVMLGITYVDVASSYEAMYYRVSALGVYIATSEYTDELKAGDRIVAVDGTEVTYGADIKPILREHEVGDEITVTVVREGKYVDVKVTLREYVPTETEASDTTSSDFEYNFGSR